MLCKNVGEQSFADNRELNYFQKNSNTHSPTLLPVRVCLPSNICHIVIFCRSHLEIMDAVCENKQILEQRLNLGRWKLCCCIHQENRSPSHKMHIGQSFDTLHVFSLTLKRLPIAFIEKPFL